MAIFSVGFGHRFILRAASRYITRERVELAEPGAMNPDGKLRKVCEIHLAVSEEPEQALAEARKHAAHHMVSLQALGYSPGEFERTGINPERVGRIREALHSDMTIEQASRERVTDSMPCASFVVGRAPDCVEPILELAAEAERPGFAQITFASPGRNHAAVIRFLSQERVPGPW